MRPGITANKVNKWSVTASDGQMQILHKQAQLASVKINLTKHMWAIILDRIFLMLIC